MVGNDNAVCTQSDRLIGVVGFRMPFRINGSFVSERSHSTSDHVITGRFGEPPTLRKPVLRSLK